MGRTNPDLVLNTLKKCNKCCKAIMQRGRVQKAKKASDDLSHMMKNLAIEKIPVEDPNFAKVAEAHWESTNMEFVETFALLDKIMEDMGKYKMPEYRVQMNRALYFAHRRLDRNITARLRN